MATRRKSSWQTDGFRHFKRSSPVGAGSWPSLGQMLAFSIACVSACTPQLAQVRSVLQTAACLLVLVSVHAHFPLPLLSFHLSSPPSPFSHVMYVQTLIGVAKLGSKGILLAIPALSVIQILCILSMLFFIKEERIHLTHPQRGVLQMRKEQQKKHIRKAIYCFCTSGIVPGRTFTPNLASPAEFGQCQIPTVAESSCPRWPTAEVSICTLTPLLLKKEIIVLLCLSILGSGSHVGNQGELVSMLCLWQILLPGYSKLRVFGGQEPTLVATSRLVAYVVNGWPGICETGDSNKPLPNSGHQGLTEKHRSYIIRQN